jgi:hypothetical protein
MSLAAQVNQAIQSAKLALGDLVVPATLRQMAKTYDTNLGRYVMVPTDVPIEGVNDKFEYMEMNAPDFDINLIKFNVFNLNNTLTIATSDFVVLNSIQYAVFKVIKTYVGTSVPVITLYLRK